MVLEAFKEDYRVMTGENWRFTLGLAKLFKYFQLRYCLYGRLALSKNHLVGWFGKYKLKKYYRKFGLEINFKNIRADCPKTTKLSSKTAVKS